MGQKGSAGCTSFTEPGWLQRDLSRFSDVYLCIHRHVQGVYACARTCTKHSEVHIWIFSHAGVRQCKRVCTGGSAGASWRALVCMVANGCPPACTGYSAVYGHVRPCTAVYGRVRGTLCTLFFAVLTGFFAVCTGSGVYG